MRGKSFEWSSIAFSETGAYRQNNQDAILAVQEGESGLFVVADGMGGHFRGELASREVVFSLKQWWNKINACVGYMPFLDVVSELEKRIKKLHKDIFALYEEMGQCGGTTLCLLLVCRDSYAVMNIGDSRLYGCQKRTCVQMTADDTWENQMQFRKMVKENTGVGSDPYCGMLVQALGAQKGLMLPVQTGIIEKRTCFLLCSDGIYKYADKEWLMAQLRKTRRKMDLKPTADRIRNSVYQNGAKDNLSLVLILAEIHRIFLPVR